MKKKCFALFIPLLLCGCGLDANVCKDSNVAFPEKIMLTNILLMKLLIMMLVPLMIL